MLFLLLALVITWSEIAAAQAFRIAGTVTDGRTHLPIDGVEVSIAEAHLRCATDTSGEFQFSIHIPGRFTLSVRRIGYAASERVVEAAAGTAIRIELSPVLLQSDEVIVRSTRVRSGVNMNAVPFSVLTEGDLERHPSLTAADALRSIPGVSLVRDGSWETAIAIRGMSRSNIVMLVDNTRIETANDIAGAFSLVDVQELDRIETLKSPGSSLWGSGAIGGVVHLMTKQPSLSEESVSHVQLAERAFGVNGMLSHHLSFDHASPRAGFRLALGYRNAGNTMTPDGELPNSQFTDMNLSGSLRVKTFGAQTLLVSYQRSQAEDAGIPGGAAFAAHAAACYTMARRELATAEYSIPDVTTVVDLMTLRVSRQVIGRNVEILQTPTLTLTPHAVHSTSSGQFETRLQPSAHLTLMIGIDVWQRSLDSRRERINKAKNEVTEERPVPASWYLSAGSYLHAAWRVAPDRVSIDAGARFDAIRVKNETTFNPEYIIRSGGIPDMKPAAQTLLWNALTVDNHSWSADAGVTIALSPSVDVSCLAAAAFRSPSLEERYQYLDLGSLVRVGDPALMPEQSTSANAGLSLHQGRFTARVDIFVNKFTDLVTEIPGSFEGRTALVKTNIGEALMYGGEIGGEIPLFDWISAQYSLAYVYGEETRAHAPLPQLPPVSGCVSLNAAMWSAGMVSIDVSYALRQDRIAQGETMAPGYSVVDLAFLSVQLPLGYFGLDHAWCTLRGGIENIFDASYRTHLSTLRGLVRREPGRNVYIGFSLDL